MTEPLKQLCIVGVGLIGGSFSARLRREGLVESVVGVGRGKPNLETAVEMGLIDRYSHELEEAVPGSDLVLIATPVTTIAELSIQALKLGGPEVIVTDGGSTKGGIIEAMGEAPGIARFVPAHPIAGTEHSGAAASFPELYDNRRVIITPTEKTDSDAKNRVADLWRACGATVVEMGPMAHDHIMAAVSHLPHMVAYALVQAVGDLHETSECMEYVAGGFLDFTRIASSHPAMWRDIALQNKEALLGALGAYRDSLTGIIEAVESDDGDALLNGFSRAKELRDGLLKTNGK